MDGIAAIPPIYFKLPEYSVAGYWNDISEAAPETDFIIYNIPQLAGTAQMCIRDSDGAVRSKRRQGIHVPVLSTS